MFKKTIASAALLTLLAGCTDGQEAAKDKEIIETVKEAPQPAAGQEQVEASTVANETASLPEYPTIMEQIDTEEPAFKRVTDNEGKRIFLLLDDAGKEQYKTVFNKATSRLKIIDLENDAEIFNDTI